MPIVRKVIYFEENRNTSECVFLFSTHILCLL